MSVAKRGVSVWAIWPFFAILVVLICLCAQVDSLTRRVSELERAHAEGKP